MDLIKILLGDFFFEGIGGFERRDIVSRYDDGGVLTDSLAATTWDAQLSESQYPNPNSINAHFVMQFFTGHRGKAIPAFGDEDYSSDFTYYITKSMITFNGAIVGNWSVIENKNDRLVLQAFLPNECKLVLTRM